MLLGDATAWADRFITFDERFLRRIVEIWPSCVAILQDQPEEDAITINLVHQLCKDHVIRRLCHWVDYQFEPFGIASDGSRYSKGKVDLAALFDQERDRYLAYECKRLNVVRTGSRSSLATEYVTKGMMRFVTEQYSEDLPLGCMLGYVMDGDVTFAADRVEAAIHAHPPVALHHGPSPLDARLPVRRFQTGHLRSEGRMILIHHALLSFRAGQ